VKRNRKSERKKRGWRLISVELGEEHAEAIEKIPAADMLKIVPKSIPAESLGRLGSLSTKCRIILGAWLEQHGYIKNRK
jgi:hypothetical protein